MKKSKHPKIQTLLQDSVDVKSVGVLDFWIFGFWGFWVYVLQLCFQSVETDPNWIRQKAALVSVFAVLLSGVRVVGGWPYIYI